MFQGSRVDESASLGTQHTRNNTASSGMDKAVICAGIGFVAQRKDAYNSNPRHLQARHCHPTQYSPLRWSVVFKPGELNHRANQHRKQSNRVHDERFPWEQVFVAVTGNSNSAVQRELRIIISGVHAPATSQGLALLGEVTARTLPLRRTNPTGW